MPPNVRLLHQRLATNRQPGHSDYADELLPNRRRRIETNNQVSPGRSNIASACILGPVMALRVMPPRGTEPNDHGEGGYEETNKSKLVDERSADVDDNHRQESNFGDVYLLETT